MTLFIACLLIHHMGLPVWWYAVAGVVWLGHVGLSLWHALQ